MPVPPPSPATVRSAAVVNEEIRELAARLALSDPERQRMTRLWAEWRDAVAREEQQAAVAREAELAA